MSNHAEQQLFNQLAERLMKNEITTEMALALFKAGQENYKSQMCDNCGAIGVKIYEVVTSDDVDCLCTACLKNN